MADFVALTDVETNAKTFLRQAVGKKFKDNFDNHQGRLTALETSLALFDHFNRIPVGVSPPPYDALGGSATLTESAYSVWRITANGVVTAGLRSLMDLGFSNVLLPITFIFRAS